MDRGRTRSRCPYDRDRNCRYLFRPSTTRRRRGRSVSYTNGIRTRQPRIGVAIAAAALPTAVLPRAWPMTGRGKEPVIPPNWACPFFVPTGERAGFCHRLRRQQSPGVGKTKKPKPSPSSGSAWAPTSVARFRRRFDHRSARLSSTTGFLETCIRPTARDPRPR